jgi:hypothetical protein
MMANALDPIDPLQAMNDAKSSSNRTVQELDL